MFVLGLGGHMRRLYDPTVYAFLQPLMPLHGVATAATVVLLLSQVPFLLNLLVASSSARAPENPWNAATLEWATTSPPPPLPTPTPEPVPTTMVLKLVNAGTEQVYSQPLTNAIAINLNGMNSFSVVAENAPSGTARIMFEMLSGPLAGHKRSESVAPYALFGDASGNYDGRSATSGDTHQLKAQALNSSGVVIAQLTLSFSFTNSGGQSFQALSALNSVLNDHNEMSIEKIFPNAVNNNLVSVALSKPVKGEVSFVVVDDLGRVLFQGIKIVSNPQQSLELDFKQAKLQPGAYYMILYGNDFISSPERIIQD
ncbi:MAG: hypothetical protein HC876_19370 [Chloroflexaceae bacterium]|nr:hypothetical protein [Chloroflexaceae bacterium]